MPPTSREQAIKIKQPIERMRGWLLAILVMEMIGTGAELVLIGHFEDPWQWLPISLMATALFVLCWFGLSRGRAPLRCLRVLMLLFIVSGGIGTVQHFRAKAAFQREVSPSLRGMELFWTAMKSVAPPALAPGVMIQMGLLGLVWMHRHRALQHPTRD